MRYDYRKHQDPETGSSLKNSRTIPDQNYTVRDILNKFTTGQPINGMMSYNEFDGEYDNNPGEKPDFDNYQPHPATLDLVDRKALEKQNRKELKEIQEREKGRQDKAKRDQEELTRKIEDYERKMAQTDKTVTDKA